MVRNYKRKTEDRWTKEHLLEALCRIKDTQLKINDAARHYGISRATLYRQYQKFMLNGGENDPSQFRTCGGNPILTRVEESVLETTVVDLRAQGFLVTSADIKRICFEYCDTNGVPNQFSQEKRMASDDWYYGFLKRHPVCKSHNHRQRQRSHSEAVSNSSSNEEEPSFSTGDQDKVKKNNPMTPVDGSETMDKAPAASLKEISPDKNQLKRSADNDINESPAKRSSFPNDLKNDNESAKMDSIKAADKDNGEDDELKVLPQAVLQVTQREMEDAEMTEDEEDEVEEEEDEEDSERENKEEEEEDSPPQQPDIEGVAEREDDEDEEEDEEESEDESDDDECEDSEDEEDDEEEEYL